MGKLIQKRKVYLHVFAPVTTVFILNNLMLLSLETPGYLVLNILSFGAVITLSIIGLQNMKEEKRNNHYTVEEIVQDSEALDKAYADLKSLLVTSCQKESLPIAKELAKICAELGPVAENMRDKKPTPFRQGSLRSAFRIETKKVA